MANGVYAADGSWNVSVVDGLSWTGVYAPDGSINVIHDTLYFGVYHPCGALRYTLVTSPVTCRYAPDGSLYVSETPYYYGSQPVTAVSGSLGGAAPAGAYYVWLFF